MAFAALERPIFVVHHFYVAFQIATSGKAGVAQITRMWSFVGMGLQMSFQRTRLHDTMARQALDPGSFSLTNNNGAHLDSAFAVLFKLF